MPKIFASQQAQEAGLFTSAPSDLSSQENAENNQPQVRFSPVYDAQLQGAYI